MRPRFPRRFSAALAALALLLVAALLTTVPGETAQAAPTGLLPTPTTAVAVPKADTVSIVWVSPTNPDLWKLVAFADGHFVGIRTAAGSARKGTITQLPPGTSIQVWVVPVTSTGGWGTWATTPAVSLARDAACPISTATCVVIDGAHPGAAATGAGLGATHSVSASTDMSRVTALGIREWRVRVLDADTFRTAEAAGASVTVLLSDLWHETTTGPDGRMYSPWADGYAYYRWYISTVAQWYADQGLTPDRWEVENEPAARIYDDDFPLTSARLAEQYKVAQDEIRKVFPTATITGPSTGPFLFGHSVEDVAAFLREAKNQGVALDSVNWHENVGQCNGCEGGPQSVRQHVEDVRAALAAAGQSSLPIDVLEYASPWEQLQPGSIVGYLSAFADEGVRYAGWSCWDRPGATGALTSSCYADPGTLSGLLMPDGTTPTDAWWTYRSFALLSSPAARLLPTSAGSATTSAVASINGKTIRALVGSHGGCTTADSCPSDAVLAGKATPTVVRLTVPTTGTWDITVSKIASTSGAAAAPTVIARTTVSVNGKVPATITAGTYTLDDGSVLVVEATRR